MSSAKLRRRECRAGNGTTTAAASPLPPPPPPIPLDPLLEILARTDATTVVRCAATSKPVRRAIAGPDFRHAITARRATDGGGGFDPSLLLGFSCVHRGSCTDDPARVAQQALRGNRLRFDAGLLEAFEPVAARGGLVVLRQREAASAPKLRVCNSLTGDTTCLPPAAVQDEYPPALVAVGDAGRSFELLIADRCLRTQTFSSKEGKWRAVVDTRLLPRHCYDVPSGNGAHPVVLGAGTIIHWLCHRCLDPGVKVLDTGTGQATQIELPPDYLTRVRYSQRLDTGFLLAASPDGRLGSMWTLAEDDGSARWTRQVVIRRQAIARAAMEGPSYSVRFLGFGERSGAVMLQMEGVGLVQLDLGSKEAVVLGHEFKQIGQTDLFQLCLHETDLCSLLQSMKPF
ncbi:hypothetical protein SETIT_9G071800v2 [Setaria italica]|uniref:DUF7595 domain-containing protein n=1 Tax=Setaria italica TaxID=4555 RepID=K4AJ65_SETIT|nr:hypothetical protein SETIT_9G071800v2 [Setaria italica]